MVHALKESRRALAANGVLLDIRPVRGDWPVEVVANCRSRPAGLADGSVNQAEELAADEAMARAVAEGWFALERTASYQYDWYWGSVDEMKARLESDTTVDWTPRMRISPQVEAEARRLMAEGGKTSSVRVRFGIHMGRYRKVTLPQARASLVPGCE